MTQLENLNFINRSIDKIPNAPSRKDPVGFILRLTKALHTYGVPAYELEQTINACAAAMDLGVQCLSTPPAITMTLLPPNEPPETYVIRVAPGEVNMERLQKTTQVAQQVIAQEISSIEGQKILKKIDKSKPLYSPGIIVLAFAMVSAGIARIFSGGAAEIVAASIIGLVIGIMSTQSKKFRLLRFLFPAVSAFVATITAFLINSFLTEPISIFVVIISGLIILLPGLSLTIAMAELATENLVSGTARLFGSAIIFVQLAFGSAIGVEIGQHIFGSIPQIQMSAVSELSIWIAVVVAVIGLVPLFEARTKEAPWFLLAAIIAFATVRYSTPFLGASLGAFFGAIMVGLTAKVISRRYNKPGALILMPGLIILVPGSVGYKSILSLIQNDILTALQTAFDVALIAISLVAGLLIASLLQLPKKDLGVDD